VSEYPSSSTQDTSSSSTQDSRRAAEGKLEALIAGGSADEAAVLALWLLTPEESHPIRAEMLQRFVKQRGSAVADDPRETHELREAFLMFILVD
jgi:hypothetical protein